MLALLYPIAFLQAASADVPLGPPPPAPACSTQAHAGFDFWVGEWDVFVTGTENQAGNSVIDKASTGCVVRERWLPVSGQNGSSMSFYNHDTRRWEQLWIGHDGTKGEFIGGIVDGEMVLTGYWEGNGPDGTDLLVRMTYTANADGSVRQFGEGSTDHGKTWQTAFDLTYRPKQDSSE